MQIDAANADLRELPIDKIERNPENPRIVFRPGEMETLQESISRYGVQVPISVYRKGKRYILIDGERRWRCSLKLNRKTIPALVQSEPDALTNLLLMFNIHALREQWDLLTIAVKLPRVIELLKKRLAKEPTEADISGETGLRRAVIRRCKLLMDLPANYREDLLDELNKPKRQQKLTEDFFIEMERALKTVERAMPGSIDDKDRVRRVLIDKYKEDTIRDITDFRYLPKIARAERVQADQKVASRSLDRLFQRNDYSIDQAYKDSVSEAYTERDLIVRVGQLVERLSAMTRKDLDDEVREILEHLYEQLARLLGRAR
jgi:ParB family chromosome partitioning protein